MARLRIAGFQSPRPDGSLACVSTGEHRMLQDPGPAEPELVLDVAELIPDAIAD